MSQDTKQFGRFLLFIFVVGLCGVTVGNAAHNMQWGFATSLLLLVLVEVVHLGMDI